jgi:hypothetical protein
LLACDVASDATISVSQVLSSSGYVHIRFRFNIFARILFDVDFVEASEFASDEVYGGGAVVE